MGPSARYFGQLFCGFGRGGIVQREYLHLAAAQAARQRFSSITLVVDDQKRATLPERHWLEYTGPAGDVRPAPECGVGSSFQFFLQLCRDFRGYHCFNHMLRCDRNCRNFDFDDRLRNFFYRGRHRCGLGDRCGSRVGLQHELDHLGQIVVIGQAQVFAARDAVVGADGCKQFGLFDPYRCPGRLPDPGRGRASLADSRSSR